MQALTALPKKLDDCKHYNTGRTIFEQLHWTCILYQLLHLRWICISENKV